MYPMNKIKQCIRSKLRLPDLGLRSKSVEGTTTPAWPMVGNKQG